jgi:hypothetical protein
MTVDLNDLEDLLHAQSVLRSRIAELGGAPEPQDTDVDGGGQQTDAAPESEEMSAEDAAWFAEQLGKRIKSANTWDLIRAFTEFPGTFTLEQVAEKMGVEAAIARARKFRLGRTENILGGRLLKQEWNGWSYDYEMDPRLRDRLSEHLREADGA